MTGEPAAPETPPAGALQRLRARLSPALLLAVAALALAGGLWLHLRGEDAALRQEVARRLADADAAGRETRALAARLEEAVRQAEVKLGLLEARLAESQSQQLALEALYQELSRNRDETALAEVEQYLTIADQQLQLAGNVRGALLALRDADARLARVGRPQLAPLRRVLARDIERLAAVPHVDIAGISARLDGLIAGVDALPLAADTRPAAAAAPAASAAESAWLRWARQAWEEIKGLVRIQSLQPEPPLLAPAQSYFLRENLRLRLLSARLALLARDPTSYRGDLKACRDWLARYFDPRAAPVAAALATLKQLHDSPVGIELPSIAASLEAVRGTKLPREKGGK